MHPRPIRRAMSRFAFLVASGAVTTTTQEWKKTQRRGVSSRIDMGVRPADPRFSRNPHPPLSLPPRLHHRTENAAEGDHPGRLGVRFRCRPSAELKELPTRPKRRYVPMYQC